MLEAARRAANASASAARTRSRLALLEASTTASTAVVAALYLCAGVWDVGGVTLRVRAAGRPLGAGLGSSAAFAVAAAAALVSGPLRDVDYETMTESMIAATRLFVRSYGGARDEGNVLAVARAAGIWPPDLPLFYYCDERKSSSATTTTPPPPPPPTSSNMSPSMPPPPPTSAAAMIANKR
ncbi:MAG: hypothetical protein AAFV49_23430, partial [Pseudomonadota bacterium]